MIVELISPSNEKFSLNYYEVNEFCKEICKHYYSYRTNPITELINMGFIRLLGSDVLETLICREELLTEDLKNKINMNNVSDYGFAEETYFELLREYLNTMNKNEMVMNR